MPRCLICLAILSLAALGCHDGPLYALKRVNPYFLIEWNKDERIGTSDHRRRQELQKLASSIEEYDPAEQAKWLVHLQQIMEDDPSAEMRHLAVRAAGKVPGGGAFDLLKQGLDDENLKVQMAACEALGTRPEPAAAALLAETAGASVNLDVRQAAVRGLSGHNGHQVDDALKLALNDSDPAIRYAAVESLKSVTGKDLGNRPEVWIAYLNGEAVEGENRSGFTFTDLF